MVYSAYGSVLLAAGGSGVSFVLGVASGIIASSRAGRSCTRNLYIVWTVRDRGEILIILPWYFTCGGNFACSREMPGILFSKFWAR